MQCKMTAWWRKQDKFFLLACMVAGVLPSRVFLMTTRLLCKDLRCAGERRMRQWNITPECPHYHWNWTSSVYTYSYLPPSSSTYSRPIRSHYIIVQDYELWVYSWSKECVCTENTCCPIAWLFCRCVIASISQESSHVLWHIRSLVLVLTRMSTIPIKSYVLL